MRWLVFVIAAYVVIAAQISLAPMLEVETRLGPVEPRLPLLLAVFIGLWAPAAVSLVAWGVLGLMLDLTATWPLPHERGLTLIGPYTLGYLAGGYVVLQARAMLFRNHPLAVGAMMLLGGLAVHLIVVAVFSVRGWYEPIEGWSAVQELARRGLWLIYSAAVGVVLGAGLMKLAPLFGFQGGKAKGGSPYARRRR